jgi:Domain of unknown function (DUF3883)/Domain of unknown function (DUF3427)
VRSLTLWEIYTREEAHDIFEQDSTFTPQTGTWGLQGIVGIANSPGDFTFFVTFGSSQGEHEFDEEISEDGVLTWQSQPRQRLDTPRIQQFIDHDDLKNSIHLFLRTGKDLGYTYFGRLGYLEHDPKREAPVYFSWQLMDWPPPPAALQGLGIVPATPKEPVTPILTTHDTLIETSPPKVKTGFKGGVGGTHPTLPGQDAKNRKLGLAGEKLVLTYERDRLTAAGHSDLAAQIVHVAAIEGDSAGYDIRSFNANGTYRYIEVKTTGGPASNAFFISPNEIEFSSKHPDSYVLIRLYGYSDTRNSANFYEKLGPVSDSFNLTATEFRARLLPSS